MKIVSPISAAGDPLVDRTDAVGRLNLSTAAEADGYLSRLDDDGHLAATVGVF
jgi:hypothetical protein